MWKTKILLAAMGALLLVMGCDDKKGGGGKLPDKPDGPVVDPPVFKPVAPPFVADSAFSFIEKQLSFGPRIPNTPGHVACADWLAGKFEEFGADVFVQKANVLAWDGSNFAIRNIVGSYKPEAAKRIIVSAHWDSRPFADKDPYSPSSPVPAANDGGSGVGVILELARQLKSTPPAVGVDFILWDAEDYGNYDIDDSWCLGSQYWSRNPHKPNYKAAYGINLDMVGAKDARFIKDGYSMQLAANQVNHYWSIGHQLGYGTYFPTGDFGVATIDDHFFVMEIAKIPMVEVIDRNVNTGEFFPHWHKVTDDLSQIDKATLKAVGQTTLEVLMREK